MLLILFFILLIVILYARQIRFLIALLFLGVIASVLWAYWWGKVSVILLAVLLISSIIGTVMEKVEKSSFYTKHKAKRNVISSENDELYRKNAFHYLVHYWSTQEGDEAADQIRYTRDWHKDAESMPDIEEWYQENKNDFI